MFPRIKTLATIAMALTAFPVAANDAVPSTAPSPAALDYFEKKVRPLLVENCYNCHSADNKAAGGLRVDDRNGLLQGGGRGAAVVPGDPERSVLLKAVSHADPKLKMPPEFKLADEQIEVLTKWIQDGAAWPTIDVPSDLTVERADYDQLRREHWSWQPLRSVTVPTVKNESWARDDVDRFLLEKLEHAGLEPVGDADRSAWLRRVTYDLTGLPPSPDEITAFLSDHGPKAYEHVVDRLLQSSAFGERWGRHWLDVARYGESTGSARNLPYPFAWRYRDYVINAFNNDKPYDQFVREQIAGDQLPFASDEQRQEQLIATGFLAIGVKDVNQRFKVRFTMDNIDEQIDTFSQAFLGLTVSCARCHDHKFDPISTKEYYGLAGIFHSTDLCGGLKNKMGGGGLDYYDPQMLLILSQSTEVDPEYDAKLASARAAADEAKARFEELRDSEEGAKLAPNGRPMRQVARQKWNRLQAEFVALSDPAARGKVALGVRDAKTIADTEIRLRGEAEKLGPVAPRGFPKVVEYEGQPQIPAHRSGRLELAQWLTSQQNPLTSRVVVNRVWQHLFGQGIVSSVDNFGVNGAKPTHPELLDHLAQRFVAEGWSFKKFIRALVLTRTYGLASAATEKHLAVDPDNQLHWRHRPRRLSAEELRDSILAAAGTLDRTRPEGSPAQELKVIELRNNGPESQRIMELVRTNRHRSIYLPLLRTLVPPSLEVFDFADQGLVTGQREMTTVATQALYLLNDPFVRSNSQVFAETLLAQSDLDESQRIDQSYLRLIGRLPSSSERDRIRFYLADYTAEAAAMLQEEFSLVAERERQAAIAATQPADAATPSNNAVSTADQTLAAAQQRTAQALNPDDVEQSETAVQDEKILSRDAQTAAWSSLIQALIGSAEFRYTR